MTIFAKTIGKLEIKEKKNLNDYSIFGSIFPEGKNKRNRVGQINWGIYF